jgi:hypothetical protein
MEFCLKETGLGGQCKRNAAAALRQLGFLKRASRGDAACALP